jgi:nucleoside-diphosphate-sugar epimerase
MNALIIGGTGIISTDVVKLALARGWDITLLNRGQHSKVLPQGVHPAGAAHSIECDTRDEGAMQKALEGKYFDVVANFLGYLPEQIEQDIRIFSGKCGQYLFISTCATYQKPDYNYLTTESTPLKNSNSLYGRRKIACEEALNHAWREKDFPVTIVRPNWTYNNTAIPFIMTPWRQPWTLIDRLQKGLPIIIPGDGESRFTITHASDFAEGFVGLMGNYHAIGHAFHITGEEALTWNQYLGIIEKITGCKAKVLHIASDFICKVIPAMRDELLGDKAIAFLFDNTKIRQFVPGFAAKVSYAQGVKAAFDYLQTHKELQTVDADYTANYDKVLAAYGAVLK